MKKILLLITLILGIFGCEKTENQGNVLHIYSWADYIPQEIYKQFEEETGIKVLEDVYATNEEMFTKLKAGGGGYDIVIPSADYTEIMMKDGMSEKLDKTKLPEIKNIDPLVYEKLQYFDPNNEYCVPFAMGGTIIVVNTKHVKDFPKDYSIYEMSQYKGKMSLLNDMREVMTSALATLGYTQTTNDEKAMSEAAELVKKWKKNLAKFDAESFGKGFATGEYWVVQGYADNIYRELDEETRKNTALIIPEKGGTSFIDSFVILKNAENKEAAYKFINFIQRPDVYAKLADILEVPSINVPARKLMKTKPLYEISDLKNTQVLRDINQTLDLQNKYWQEILISE